MNKALVYILLIASSCLTFGQDMLIEQIASKEVVRQSFNATKELTSQQVFQVGQMQTKGNQLVVRAQVSLYDEDLKLTDQYITKYICEPDKSDILLTVFPFAVKAMQNILSKPHLPVLKSYTTFLLTRKSWMT